MHVLTHDTAFAGMLSKIEEELMVVGTSSFIFKVLLNTTTFEDNKWAYPLEFGEVLVPMIAFSYCGLGVVLILVSLNQCNFWTKAQNLRVEEIMGEYVEAAKTCSFM
jgi:hypothetical protein